MCAKLHAAWNRDLACKEKNVVALQRAEMRMVRWMCGVKLKDRLLSKELKERLSIVSTNIYNAQLSRMSHCAPVARKPICLEFTPEAAVGDILVA